MDDRKPIGQSLLLAIAPALVSSMVTGVATWSLAVRDAKRAGVEQATEKDQVVFTALRDRIATLEGSVQEMTKVVTKVAQVETSRPRARSEAKREPARSPETATAPSSSPSTSAPSAPAPSAPAPTSPEPQGTKEEERRVLIEVLDRLKDRIPVKPMPEKVQDLPLYLPKR